MMKPPPLIDTPDAEGPDRSAIGRRSRSKGARYENDVARRLADATGATFFRVAQSGGFQQHIPGQTKPVNAKAGDIACSDRFFPLHIECKHLTKVVDPIMGRGTKQLWDLWLESVEEGSSHFRQLRTEKWAPVLIVKRTRAAEVVFAPPRPVLAHVFERGPWDLQVLQYRLGNPDPLHPFAAFYVDHIDHAGEMLPAHLKSCCTWIGVYRPETFFEIVRRGFEASGVDDA